MRTPTCTGYYGCHTNELYQQTLARYAANNYNAIRSAGAYQSGFVGIGGVCSGAAACEGIRRGKNTVVLDDVTYPLPAGVTLGQLEDSCENDYGCMAKGVGLLPPSGTVTPIDWGAVRDGLGVAGRKTWQTTRLAINTVDPVATALSSSMSLLAVASGADCWFDTEQMMNVCTGAKWGFLNGGTTYGSTYIQRDPILRTDTKRHEAGHADQWVIFGPALAVIYPVSAAVSGECNWLEHSAGYKSGGYDTCS